MCVWRRKEGTEDCGRQQGEGKRGRSSVPKAVGTWRPCRSWTVSERLGLRTVVAEQRGQRSAWLKRHPHPTPGVSVVLSRLRRGCDGSFAVLLPEARVEGGSGCGTRRQGQVRTLYFSYRSAAAAGGGVLSSSVYGLSASTSPWRPLNRDHGRAGHVKADFYRKKRHPWYQGAPA